MAVDLADYVFERLGNFPSNKVVALNEIFYRRELFSKEESEETRRQSEEIDRKLNGLMNSRRGRKRNGTIS
jgi:hypothetical protein